MTEKVVVAHTNGACEGNPGRDGWGVALRHGDVEKELFGGEPSTTNDRMELTAAIRAVEALERRCEVQLHTDAKTSSTAFATGSTAGSAAAG